MRYEFISPISKALGDLPMPGLLPLSLGHSAPFALWTCFGFSEHTVPSCPHAFTHHLFPASRVHYDSFFRFLLKCHLLREGIPSSNLWAKSPLSLSLNSLNFVVLFLPVCLHSFLLPSTELEGVVPSPAVGTNSIESRGKCWTLSYPSTSSVSHPWSSWPSQPLLLSPSTHENVHWMSEWVNDAGISQVSTTSVPADIFSIGLVHLHYWG